MRNKPIVVDGYAATDKDTTDLREDTWSLALDQRAFGPRRLVVAFADRCGRLRGLAHAPRTEPAEAALAPCIQHLGRGAAAAVAFCDESVVEGPPPPEIGLRFALARSIASSYGIYLVDWIACDDQLFRSSRFALEADWQLVGPALRWPRSCIRDRPDKPRLQRRHARCSMTGCAVLRGGHLCENRLRASALTTNSASNSRWRPSLKTRRSRVDRAICARRAGVRGTSRHHVQARPFGTPSRPRLRARCLGGDSFVAGRFGL